MITFGRLLALDTEWMSLMREMNKISKLNNKFLLSTGLILLIIGLLSLFLNRNFIERYFLYEEKQQIRSITDTLINSEPAEFLPAVEAAELSGDVVIVMAENSPDNNILNERIKDAFLDKGISLHKYWLWDQDQLEVGEQGRKLKIYNQGKFNYSLLVEYFVFDDYFVAAVKIVPSLDKTLALVNKVNLVVVAGACVLLFLSISLLVNRIIAPLYKIRKASNSIANLDFVSIDLHTGDELELLADDINSMSRRLQDAHQLLVDKNRQMEELLANVSHDLKTPIALIKMYTYGIRDGMDDGTFLDTIIAQNQRMEMMVERLLDLAKVQQQQDVRELTDISAALRQQLEEYNLGWEGINPGQGWRILDSVKVIVNPEAIYLIYSNMISNAMKYSRDGSFLIDLYTDGSKASFRIENPVNPAADIDPQKIWEPFYVAEKSRNKEMSGTGLGLSIVREVCVKYGIQYRCLLQNERIVFTFEFS